MPKPGLHDDLATFEWALKVELGWHRTSNLTPAAQYIKRVLGIMVSNREVSVVPGE
jgi:hypothetical protein